MKETLTFHNLMNSQFWPHFTRFWPIMSMMLQMKDWISQSYRKIQCSIVTMSRQTATQGVPNECSPLIVALAKLLKRSKCTFSSFNISPICNHFLFCGTSAPLQFSLLAGLQWNSWAPSGQNMERQHFITLGWVGPKGTVDWFYLVYPTSAAHRQNMLRFPVTNDWHRLNEFHWTIMSKLIHSVSYMTVSHIILRHTLIKVICKMDTLLCTFRVQWIDLLNMYCISLSVNFPARWKVLTLHNFPAVN